MIFRGNTQLGKGINFWGSYHDGVLVVLKSESSVVYEIRIEQGVRQQNAVADGDGAWFCEDKLFIRKGKEFYIL